MWFCDSECYITGTTDNNETIVVKTLDSIFILSSCRAE